MNEIIGSSALYDQTPEHLTPLGAGNLGDQKLHEGQEAAEALTAAYRGWLERRGIDPTSIPHFTMRQREFDLFRNVPPNYIGDTRELYHIPRDDQDGCQYALVDIEPDDPNLPPKPLLVTVDEVDFGTVMDREQIDSDFQNPDPDPNNPLTPKSGGAYRTVNIAETISTSTQGLQTFAVELMRGKTVDPLTSHYGDIGVRAGGLAADQQDAYVWTTSPFARSVELTVAFPSQYDSVCIVRGQRCEAANGKAGMAQIVNPEVVFKIDGENLRKLQLVYKSLYLEPDFALTEVQRRERDELFNNHLANQISHQASNNRARKQEEEQHARRRRQQPLRALQIPRP
ncbi:hypothetical protein IPL85_00320 [Candidatus Saccharibacteria bacterium]|nr:MAG: hypothetical protein IPL85_00320 [Candidatus Saccharibacteria bacterium]